MDRPPRKRPIDLVRGGGTKPNGQPVIRADRVHHWLKGQRPSYDLAVATARALGVPERQALAAAGYAAEQPPATADLVWSGPHGTVEVEVKDTGTAHLRAMTVSEAIENDPDLPAVAKAHLLNQYELLRQLRVSLPPELLEQQEARRLEAEAQAEAERAQVDAEALADVECLVDLPRVEPRTQGAGIRRTRGLT